MIRDQGVFDFTANCLHYLPLPLEKNELHQLPNLWIWTKIGEFVEIVRGGSPRPAGSPRYFGGNIPWITVGELTKDETIYLTKVSSFVTEEGRENSRFINADTLLLTNSGATLGVPKITLIDGCINDGSVALLGLDPIPKLYLYYFLKSQTKRLRQINQGAAQPNLNTDIVRNIVVPFPPMEEQKEVINEIERHISQIDHLENTIITSLRQSESLRQSILKRAFEGKLVPQDSDDEPASVLLERIKSEKAHHTAETKKGKTLQPTSPKRKIKNGN
jgi:type I restriction enzyme S subunit